MNIDCVITSLLYCDLNTIFNCSMTNKCIMALNTQYLWKLLCDRDYENGLLDDYYKNYKLCYDMEGLFNDIQYDVIEYYSKFHLVDFMGKVYKFENKKVSELFNLTNLSLYRVKIIPSQLGILINLYKIQIGCSTLKVIPTELGKLNQLECLVIHDTSVEFLPRELGNLLNLKILMCANNLIQNIPTTLGNLTKLRVLNIKEEFIEHIPSELGNCFDLRIINLSKNEISNIPIEFGNLVNLEHLKLKKNKIESLPSELNNLINLKRITLFGNPIKCINELGSLKKICLF